MLSFYHYDFLNLKHPSTFPFLQSGHYSTLSPSFISTFFNFALSSSHSSTFSLSRIVFTFFPTFISHESNGVHSKVFSLSLVWLICLHHTQFFSLFHLVILYGCGVIISWSLTLNITCLLYHFTTASSTSKSSYWVFSYLYFSNFIKLLFSHFFSTFL